MNEPNQPTDPRLAAARIDAVLARQLRRLRGRFLVHGLGWMLAAVAVGVLAPYLLDRLLTLPAAVRVVLTLGVLAWLVAGLRRRVLLPLGRRIDTTDVALAIERRFPELGQVLVSAAQLKAGLVDGAATNALRDQSRAMVERVVADAAAAAERLPVGAFLEPQRTRRVWATAALALAALVGTAALSPAAFAVFLGRAIGLDVDYPRRTHLHVELPTDVADYRIERDADTATVTMASGGDLPVLVRVEGEVPREVSLVLDGPGAPAESVAMLPVRGEDRVFRYSFRRVRGEFSFRARGGDDPEGDLRVTVRTIDPPLVGTIDARLTFPAYTGLEAIDRSGGAIEGLVGTAVELDVTTTGLVATATLEFLESDRSFDLEPTSIQDDSGVGQRFRGAFVIDRSDRYRIRLVSPDGLANPRPGEYPVIALQDNAPVGRILLPGGSDVHVAVPGARIPVRVAASDDFGLATLTAAVRVERAEQGIDVDLLADPDAAATAGESGPIRETVRTTLVPIDRLAAVGPAPAAGDTIALGVTLVDNRAPEAGTTPLAERQVYVVDVADLQRRIAGHFRRVRDRVEEALAIQQDRAERTAELLLEPPAAGATPPPELVALNVGQGRILSSMRSVFEDLMQAYDVHLFNGLEGADSLQVPRVVELYLQTHGADRTDRAWLPEFYRAVAAARAAGRIGPMDKVLDPILDMVSRADRVVHELARPAVERLERAAVAANSAEIADHLRAVAGLQREILAEFGALLERLDEWNEFQDVVQQVRALRDAQRDVESRTESLRSGDRR